MSEITQQDPKLLLSGRLAAWFKIISVVMISLVAFEVVAVSTAMPYVVEDLNGKQYYALVSGIPLAMQLLTTALAGPWCDAKGPKPPLYIGLGLFITGLLIATFSPSILFLVLGRGIQGLGGGLTIVPLYVMVGAHVKASKQPAFFAAFALAWVLPSLIGSLVAGFFVEHVHWRLVFGICPIFYAALLPLAASKFKDFPRIHEPRPFVISRALLIASAISGVCVAALQIISGTKPADFTPWLIAAALIISIVLFTAARTLFPEGTLVARRGVPATIALRGLLNGTTVATEIYLVLLLKEVHNWGATQAGFVMTAGSLTWALGSWIQGKLSMPRHRALLPIIGPSLQLIGMIITIFSLLPHTSGWIVMIGWLLAGFGTGMIYPATTVHALNLTPAERHGEVSSAISVADTLSASVLMAYLGIIYALAYGLGAGTFALVVGFSAALVSLALWVATRITTSTRAF